MTAVRLDSPLASPASVVAPRLLTVLSGYAQRDDFALTVDLGLAGAAMSVPVKVELGGARTRTPSTIPIALAAARHGAWFPAFRGEVRSEAAGPLESVLRLAGSYETPLGALGEIADRTVLGHAAERSLRLFLDRLRADTLEEIRRAELAVRRGAAG